MKIKWGIPICLFMILVFLGFFARAEIRQHLEGDEKKEVEKIIFTGGQVDIFFNEIKVISDLPIATYHAMELTPSSANWISKTIDPLVDYLKAHNEKVLIIKGHFLMEEKHLQLGGYKNIGEARAGVLKQELISKGISAPRILIETTQSNTQTLKQILEFECLNDATIIP